MGTVAKLSSRLPMTCRSCGSITPLDLPERVATLVSVAASAAASTSIGTSTHVEEVWLELAGVCHACSARLSA